MSKGRKFGRTVLGVLGLLLFAGGVLLGLALAGSAVAADIEAKFYGFDRFPATSLPGVRCPVLMTVSDTATISGTFRNPTEKPVDLMIRTDVSNRLQFRSGTTTLALAPGERKALSWTVTADDIDLGHFVFAKVVTYPVYPYSFREATCGTLVLNLPNWTGGQVFAVALVGSLLGIVVGLVLWEVNNRPWQGRTEEAAWAMRLLGVMVAAAMFAGFQGWWLIGGILFVLAVMLISVSLYILLR